MKKMLWTMASVCMLAACSDEAEPLLQGGDGEKPSQVTVNAYVPDGTGSRLAYENKDTEGLKVSWNESEETFSVLTTDEDEPVTFTQTGGSTFEAPEGFEFEQGKDYYAFYPELSLLSVYDESTGQEEPGKASAEAVPFYISMQTGQLDESMNLMYAEQSADGDFHFHHMLAVMKFTLKGIEGKLVQEVKINFTPSDANKACYTYGTVNVTGETPVFTGDDPNGSIGVSAENLTADDDGNYVFYAYLPPLAGGTEISIDAQSIDGENHKRYTDNFTVNADGIKAEYYYTAVRTMDVKETTLLNYTASDVEELKTWLLVLNSLPYANLTLTADIDLTSVELEYDHDYDGTEESNWPLIYNYQGTFDGGGYTIKGLTVKATEYQNAGLFESLASGAVVKNVNLVDVTLTGYDVGGVAGVNNGGTVQCCSVSGNVNITGSGTAAGGIVGNNISGTVIACYSNAASVSASSAGGVVGNNNNGGTVTACYSNAASVSNGTVGGVVGVNHLGSTVNTCYWSFANSDTNGHGIGYNYVTDGPTDDNATRVDGTNVNWAGAASAMNALFSEDFGWEWKENTAGASTSAAPLVLEKKESGNNEFVPV